MGFGLCRRPGLHHLRLCLAHHPRISSSRLEHQQCPCLHRHRHLLLLSLNDQQQQQQQLMVLARCLGEKRSSSCPQQLRQAPHLSRHW